VTTRAGPTSDTTCVLVHGYTLAELHQLARLAVHTTGRMGMAWHDRYELAYSAIATHLYTATDPPRRHLLVTAGRSAIYDTVAGYLHHHGYYRARTIGAAAGPGSSPAFARFWHTPRDSDSAVDELVDQLTVQQIWPTLTPRQQQAVAALAALGDYHAAAHALGIQPQTYRTLLGRARTEFRARWHEGERPSRPWGTDRRVGRYPTAPQRGEVLTTTAGGECA